MARCRSFEPMPGLSALAGCLRPSLEDAKVIVARRLLISAILYALTLALALYVVGVTQRFYDVALLVLPGGWTIGILCYADAVRLVLASDFRLTWPLVLRIIGFGVAFYVSVIAAVSFIQVLLLPLHIHLLTEMRLLVAIEWVTYAYFFTRFAFGIFALRNNGVFDAIGYSWRLTARGGFWTTALAVAPIVIWYEGFFRYIKGLNLWQDTLIRVTIPFGVALLGAAFCYPLLARWMLIREHLNSQPVASATD